MELLLLKDVANCGKKGDVVKVKDGFGRNFLIPRDLALPATRGNKEFFDEQRKRSEARKAEERKSAEERANDLSSVVIKITVKAGEGDKLFGSVTRENIAEELAKQGIEFDKKQIKLKDPLKSLGKYSVDIEVYPQVKATIQVELVPAEKQEKSEETE